MQGETIICIATRVWRSLWRDSQQIMSRMAAHNRILYFEPGRDPDRSVTGELWRNAPNFLGLRSTTVARNLHIIPTPSSLPYAHRHLSPEMLRVVVPLVMQANTRILIRHVRSMLQRLSVKSPILWLYDPYHVGMVGQFGEKLSCYYNYDEHADALHNHKIRPILQALDNQLTKRVDVVFATSRGQQRRRAEINPNSHFIPNGVDFNAFNRALDPDLALPPDIAALPRPIIGLAGWLGYQIDTELLQRVAEAYPNCSLALVGPDELAPEDSRRLRAMPNVHFLGRKEHAELPAYLRAFDVALIPYMMRGHVHSIYPLKLHEYLAAGRAIVTTAMPELLPFADIVRIGGSEEGFIHHIGAAIGDMWPASVAARTAIARENTWEKRVEAIYQILDERIDMRKEERSEGHLHRLDTLRQAS